MDDASRLTSELMAAVEHRVLDAVLQLLAAGADPNGYITVEWGRTVHVLGRAAEKSSVEIVTALLDAGAELRRSHALSRAAEGGQLEVMRLLIQRGAGLEWGDTLESAVKAGQYEAARLLLEHGVDPNQGAIHEATKSFSLNPMLRLLLAHGADPNAEWEQENFTPLFGAVGRYGSRAAVKALLAAGANVHHCCGDGDDALMFAAAYRECADAEDVLPLLLAAGADPNALNDNSSVNTSALIAAVEHGHGSNVLHLLAAGADPNIIDCRGVTPVLAAVRTGSLPALRSLIDAGPNVSVRDPDPLSGTSEHVINMARRQCIELLYILGDAEGAAALRHLPEVE